MNPELANVVQVLIAAAIGWFLKTYLPWLNKPATPATPEPVKPNSPTIPDSSPTPINDHPLLNILLMPLLKRLLGIGGGVHMFGAGTVEDDAAVSVLVNAIKADPEVSAKVKAAL
jgi:hypothetical protein